MGYDRNFKTAVVRNDGSMNRKSRRFQLGFHGDFHYHDRMVGQWAAIRLERYVAVDNQHSNKHSQHVDGFLNSEHSES